MYKFPYNEKNGYVKLTVPEEICREYSHRRKKSIFYTYECRFNQDNKHVVILKLSSNLSKMLMILSYPIALIMGGVVNYKKLNKHIYQKFNEKETGSFTISELFGNSVSYEDFISATIGK